MESEGSQGPPANKKRRSGDRCVIYGCSNTMYDGFFMHALPGKMPASSDERFSAHQRQWIAFIGRKRKFSLKDARTYRRIMVCSGHFKQDDYNQTDVGMFRNRLRRKPPSLKSDAVPSIDNAVHPFPPSWFIPIQSLTPGVPEIPDAAAPIESVERDSQSEIECQPSASRRNREDSVYSRRKEAEEIFADHGKRAKEEAAKDFLERSKGEQCCVKMRDHRVGTFSRGRSCKIQVKPVTFSKGTQVEMTTVLSTKNEETLTMADTGTQTTESSFTHADENREETEVEDFEVDDFPEDSIDDEELDPTYFPPQSRNRSTEKTIRVMKPQQVIEEEKYIVFQSQLLELFEVCSTCQSQNVEIMKIQPPSFGSQVKIKTNCKDCGQKREWNSQPRIGNIWAGNLLLSAAILYGGASPTKILRVLRHMNLSAISNSTFMDHQREYLQPAIVRVYKREQRQLINHLEDEKVVLGGDGRCDSPGHNAKYGSYALMDIKRKKILDIQLVQSNEVANSNAMEKEGLARGLTNLTELGVEVKALITDRHAQVAKWMRENYPQVDHRYDVWHMAKGLKKKITAIAKMKDCETANLWKQSITNHIYWCASSTPDGDGEKMVAKFDSILNHIRDVHQHESELFPKCAHQEDYPQREWLKEGSKVFHKLSEEITKTRLRNDLKRMSPLSQTSSVEAYHSVLLYWCPKMLAYSFTGMQCRLLLSVLHWNENGARAQATKKDGTPIFTITFPKAKDGRHSVSKVLTACTFGYVEALLMETLLLVKHKQKVRDTIPELASKQPLASKYERPNKEEAIKQAQMFRRYTMQNES